MRAPAAVSAPAFARNTLTITGLCRALPPLTLMQPYRHLRLLHIRSTCYIYGVSMSFEAENQTATETISPDRRSDPQVRKRMSGPAVRSFLALAERWKLSVDEQRGLLGWP